MEKKITKAEQNICLVMAYTKMNEEGRNILDIAVQKLSEIRWFPQATVKSSGSILHSQKLEKTENNI